ncbi:LamB/YcsF family protein [Leucobacter coleopterorum]|uniref:5-oxoprolinase subunit A n=1 Tax=Leucobacter coleopterorum TaxID=2714933 RepID=A0ABX6JTN6_9MICO|nr:5-oxoprolinase subunit PxpA [Leucobacter coleopterorum]QIM17646.1 LamB/YcsF family protein [Leucobacter coleopterorum]
MRIDLNSDLGEHFGSWSMGDDESMLEIVTSANVACGFHAGDPRSILSTLRAAAARGVAVGAHIAYPDLVGFGRRPMSLAPAELEADIIYQIGALQALARVAGTEVRYVKPHGALYNSIAFNEAEADTVIRAIRSVDPELALVCLAASPLVEQSEAAGTRTIPEAFADRAYEPNGALVSRREPDAVLHDPVSVAERMLRLVQTGAITARDGSEVAVRAESICVHGDSPAAVDLARAVRASLLGAGIELSSVMEPV